MASKKHKQDQSWASIDDKIDTSMPDQMRLLSVDCPLFPSRFEFPFKLHCILEDASCQGNEHIISWLPHGRAFKIHSKEAFETEILPKYYTNNRKSSSSSSSPPKYRSFSRQLAIYGFQLNKKGESFGSPDHGSCRHPLMVRSKPALCTGMIRQKVKGNRTRKTNKGGHQDEEEAGPETQQVVPNPTCEPASSSLVLATTSEGRPPNGATTAAVATGKDNLLEFAILANKFLESHKGSDPAPYLSSTSSKTAIDGGHHSSSSAFSPLPELFPSSGSSSSKNPYTNKECWWNNGMLLEEQEEPQQHFLGEPLDMNSFFDWSQDESAIYQGIEYLLSISPAVVVQTTTKEQTKEQ